MPWRALTLVSFLSLSVAAGASEGADTILRDLGLEPSAEIVSVEAARRADGWVVVRLVPQGSAKLVADPGISVAPVDELGLPSGAVVSLKDVSREYFDLPPVLEIEPGAAPALRVEYAYCVIAKQCLFGDTIVQVPDLDESVR
jgi:hypothetical protein